MTRQGLFIVGGLLVLGCGSQSSTNSNNDGGVTYSIPSHDNDCVVTVTVTPSQAVLPANAKSATFTATATIQHDSDIKYPFVWYVRDASDRAITPIVSGSNNATASLTVSQGGVYHFTALLAYVGQSGRYCGSSQDGIASPGSAKEVSLRLRLTPPVVSDLPRQERTVTVRGGTPVDTTEVALEAGVHVKGTLEGPSMVGTPGTLRFVSPDGNDVVVAAASDGKFDALVLGGVGYTPLLLPLDASLAPHRFGSAVNGAQLQSMAFPVTAGLTVTGTVKDDQGAPIAAARVVLRGTGPSPAVLSSVGVTDGSGAFTLHAEQGFYRLSASAAGWPDIDAALPAVQGAMKIDVAYQLPRVAVGGKVVASDGTKALEAARVTARAALAGAALVSVDGAAATPAAGTMQLAAMTAKDGTFASVLVPAGDYTVLVEPPVEATDGITALQRTLAGADTWQLTLAPRNGLTGIISDGKDPVVGARVVVLERIGLGAVRATTTTSQGKYLVPVDPAAELDVTVEPPSGGKPLMRYHGRVAAGTTSLSIKLERGQLLGGVVRPPTGAPIARALVEAFCATCTEPLAVGLSDSDGRFTLLVPDPGF